MINVLLSKKKLQDIPLPISTQNIPEEEKGKFSNNKIKFNYLPKVTDEVDYDLIQFGEEGIRFWVDYSGSDETDERKIQFLRNICIKSAISRISSMMKPKTKEMLGPFSKKQIKKCEDKLISISDYYLDNSVGNAHSF